MSFENWTIEDLIARCTDFDEMTLEMDSEEFAALRRKITEMKQPGNSPAIPEGYVMAPKEPTEEMNKAGWSAMNEHDAINPTYRAMLAAATHDTHALNSLQSVDSVTGKWIPVSEQMPDVGVKVLCFPAKDEPIHATFNGQLWLQDVSWSGSEEPIDNVIPVTVTHWMPLPTGPQEGSL